MSTKKQISSLCQPYSVFEETPEEFLDETDVDSYFYHNILDISQSHHGIVRVSKRSNKKSFAFKVFHFCDPKLQHLFSRKKSAFPQKKLNFYSKVWGNFSKLLIKPTKYRRFLDPKLNLRLDKLYFFYQRSQPLYDVMPMENENLEFVEGVNFEFNDSLKNNGTAQKTC